MTNNLGTRLRSMRTAAGLAQAELAELAGLSDAYVSLVESGKRQPSAKALSSLAAALTTTPDFLEHGDDSPAEAAVREAIAKARTQLADGHPECSEATLRAIDVAHVSHGNRLGYLVANGLVRDALGEINASIVWFEQAIEEARRVGSPKNIAEIGMWIVSGHHDAGALDAAVRTGEEILAEVETLGIDGSDEHLRLASTLVWSIHQRGDYLAARTRVRQFVEIAEHVGTARGRGSVWWNAALIVQEANGDHDEAVRLAQAALDAMLEDGSARDVPRLRYDYATILLKCDPPRAAEALEQLELAEEKLRRVGSRVEVARCQMEKARALLYLGDLDDAEELVTRGLADMAATGTLNLDTCNGFTLLGDLASLRGDMNLAGKRYGWAADGLSMMSATRYAGDVWAGLGRRLAGIGDQAGAIASYRRALDVMHVPASAPFVEPAILQPAQTRSSTTTERRRSATAAA